jgi:hypothetical protein
MKKARTLLILAIWIALLPYLGFPVFWKNLLFLITGLALAYISYLEYRKARSKDNLKKKVFDNFSENYHETHEYKEEEQEEKNDSDENYDDDDDKNENEEEKKDRKEKYRTNKIDFGSGMR